MNISALIGGFMSDKNTLDTDVVFVAALCCELWIPICALNFRHLFLASMFFFCRCPRMVTTWMFMCKVN